jgi:hypothetical protein
MHHSFKPGHIFGIDFDGTCVNHAFPEMGEDCPGAVDVLKKIVAAGGKLVLWTMRSNTTESPVIEDPTLIKCGADSFLDHAIKWFSDRDIPLWGIQENPTQKAWTSSPKAYCHTYIDDAALGCPLLFNLDFSSRPYVDWAAVDAIIFPENK